MSARLFFNPSLTRQVRIRQIILADGVQFSDVNVLVVITSKYVMHKDVPMSAFFGRECFIVWWRMLSTKRVDKIFSLPKGRICSSKVGSGVQRTGSLAKGEVVGVIL
jgi:hypothetical protein